MVNVAVCALVAESSAVMLLQRVESADTVALADAVARSVDSLLPEAVAFADDAPDSDENNVAIARFDTVIETVAMSEGGRVILLDIDIEDDVVAQ